MKNNSAVSEFQRLAGLGDPYASWRTPLSEAALKPPVPFEAKEGTEAAVRSNKAWRMAHLIENDRLAGALSVPDEPPEYLVRRLDEAHPAPGGNDLAHLHHGAHHASHQAHAASATGNHDLANKHHEHSAAMHDAAAKHLAAAGHDRLAYNHALWSTHHKQHAAHHARQLGNVDQTVHQPQHGAPPKKQQARHPATSGHAGARHPETAHMPAPTKPQRKHDGDDDQVKRAQHTSRQAYRGHSNSDASPTDHAHAHDKASREHLQAALRLFHSGDHEKAVQHFNVAIHHRNKSKAHHQDAQAQDRQHARSQAGGGPRARVGRAHI